METLTDTLPRKPLLERSPAFAAEYDAQIAQLEARRARAETPLARIRELGHAYYLASRAFIDYQGDNPETDERLCTASSEARLAFQAACDAHFVRPTP